MILVSYILGRLKCSIVIKRSGVIQLVISIADISIDFHPRPKEEIELMATAAVF